MIDWAVVAAFIGPLLGGLGLVAGFFAYLGKKRDQRVDTQIKTVTDKLESNQMLMQQQIAQVSEQLNQQQKHLEQQDSTLTTALQSIARIEGRLSGPLQVSMRDITGST